MGYTHCWRFNGRGSQRDWSQAVLRAATIIQHSPVPLGDALGDGEGPELSDRHIACNGRGKDGCETFELPTILTDGRDFCFCKTAQEPYDLVVTAVLAALQHDAPGCITVSSDGCPHDWVAGVRLARMLLRDDTIDIPAGVYALGGYTEQHHAAHLQEGTMAREALAGGVSV